MTPTARPAAVAGLFYTDDPVALRAEVRAYLADGAARADAALEAPGQAAAVICPHAGYLYSGPVAGSAFAAARGRTPARVVLVGPAHRLAYRGLADADAATWETPLGVVRVDVDAIAALRAAGHVAPNAAAHADEHCLEVMLPFIQEAFGDVPVVPLLVGSATTEAVAAALDAALQPDDLLVVSTDLSHFMAYGDARERDLASLRAIVDGRADALGPSDACGHRGVAGAMAVAARRGWRASLLDYRNSGDTAGGRDRVVGYGALAIGSARG